MTITINPKALGFDGRCDHDAGCERTAVTVMLSASHPAMWSADSRPASLAFLCSEHLDAEPLARREDAEGNARWVEGTEKVWAALLDSYPEPLAITITP